MIKLLTVIGARPQIIKAAAISRAIKECFFDRVEEKILHTGQHYDANMSQVFFDELAFVTFFVELVVVLLEEDFVADATVFARLANLLKSKAIFPLLKITTLDINV